MDYKIDRLHELNEDDIKVLVFDKKEIIVVKHEGEFYAFLGKCTHLGCNLKNGTYSKGIITCPCHGSSFSVIDGSVVKWIEDWPVFVNRKVVHLLIENWSTVENNYLVFSSHSLVSCIL